MPKPIIKIGEGGQKLAVILPSLLCNYNCSYCRIKSKTRFDYEHELDEWLDALIRIGAPVVHIAGGEPTALKGFEEFVVNYPSSVRMTTNLWRDPSKYSLEFWQKFEYMTLSFHPEYTTIEEFAEKVDYLVKLFKDPDECPRMACTIVAIPEYLDNITGWIEMLSDLGVNARAQYYNAPADDSTKTYTDDELKRLKQLNIPMSAKVAGQEVYSKPTLKSCDAGRHYVHINMRGTAKRCSRDKLSPGNIFDGTFKWFETNKNCVTACTEACDLTFTEHKVINKSTLGGQIKKIIKINKRYVEKGIRYAQNMLSKKPVHNLEYQRKALEGFAEVFSCRGKDILEIGSDPELRVIQTLGRKAKSVFGITNAKGHWKHNESGDFIVSDNVCAGNYDARAMPFEDESFDAILSIATFEHILGLDVSLDEMYRVLRPGGIVYSPFGPIWSCAVGHHIYLNIDEDTFFRFWKEDLNPIPNYYHLLYTEEELTDILIPKYGDKLARKITNVVYHSQHINRLMYSDYVRIFNESKFTVKKLEDLVIRPLDEDFKERLAALYGDKNNYQCGTIEVLLYKPMA